MADTSRKKSIRKWAAKKLEKIRDDLRSEADDHVIHQWNVGKQLANAAETDPDIRNLVLNDWAHRTVHDDDHKRRPDLRKDKDRPELPFAYDAARLQYIPIGIKKIKTTGEEEVVEGPQRIRFSDATMEHNRAYLKIVRDNKNAVIARFEIDEAQMKMLISAQRRNPKLKTNDDVMRHKYAWEEPKAAPPEADDSPETT